MGRTIQNQVFVDKKTDIGFYWSIIARRKFSIFILVVLATTITGLYIFSQTPVYRATATLLIEPDQPRLTSIEDLYGLSGKTQQYYLTQVEVLQSRLLARLVIEHLKLDENEEFLPGKGNPYNPVTLLRQWLAPSGKKEMGAEDRLDYVVNIFQSRLNVVLIKDTQVVKISFESISPSLAAAVPNALANAYIEDQLFSRVKLTKQATGWLESRLEVLKANLESSEKALQDYMERYRLVDVKGVSTLTANELQELMIKMVDAKTKYSELTKRYGYMNPKIIAAKAEFEASERELESGKARIQSIGRKGVRLRELQRQVEGNRQLYDTFLARLKEASQAVELHAVNARLSDPAVKPLSPFKPKAYLIVSLAFQASLLLSILLVFVLEAIDKTFKKTDDVAGKTGQRLLGTLPLMRTAKVKKIALIDTDEQGSQEFSEAMNSIRTNLILHDGTLPNKVILVTSSVDEEGKSTVASNLAASFAMMQRVLLIDADLRQSEQTRSSGISGNQPGLADMLSGQSDAETVIVQLSESGMDVLPCGLNRKHPLELLSSDTMHALVDRLAGNYDRIIIDAPSMLELSDALMLSRYANSVVYVVESGVTHEKNIRQGISLLEENHAVIAGLILNKVS